MSEPVLGKCRYCGAQVTYDNGETYTKCSACGENLVIAEFQNEQIRIKRALEEGEQAKKDLEAAEKAIEAEREKVWKVISEMDGLKGSLKEQEAQLNRLLKESQLDQETQETMLSLLRTMKNDQQQGQNSILSIINQIFGEQKTAKDKITALQMVTAQLTEKNTDMLNAVVQISSMLHIDIEQRNRMSRDLMNWFADRSEQDQAKLQEINAISSAILAKQDIISEKVDDLRKKAEENQDAIKSFQGKWEQSQLNQLVAQYHRAENLQMDMAFDKAEDEYGKVIVMGGKDPEVYWRIILCHYGVVYQKDNEGNLIPTILRPDLSLQLSIVNDLENSYRSEKDQQYYSAKLKRINSLLDKYRHCQMTSQYDVFLSVKQKIHYNGKEVFTEDYKIAGDLYHYLMKKGLRVFNSEQPDCRKPGEEWEPYILAALLSSKVMIVVGTSTEYMESQWVQNEWRRFQWLQKEEAKKTGKTDRKLLCFIDNMTGYDLPKNLEPLQAIINAAGAYRELDKVIESSFPNLTNDRGPINPDASIELIRKKMVSWLAFKQYDLVKEEYLKIIREGTYSLDALLGLCNVCAAHRLTQISKLETASFDLDQEETIQIILENSKDQNDLIFLRGLILKNKRNAELSSPQKAAENGDAEAQNKLGNTYYDEKKYKEAAIWYRKSSEQGNSAAQNKLGYMYYLGYGVSQDYLQAVSWFRKSAEQGNADAQNNLGLMYEYGYGVQRNLAEAVAYYQKSAEQGNSDAQNKLGLMYQYGNGMTKDYIEAVKWYRKSAEQGNANAQNNLGFMYEHGYGVKQDYTEARIWYIQSAKLGNSDAQNNIGNVYKNGYGVTRNEAEAIAWYRKSAEQGNAKAQNNLGCMYHLGYGIKRDYSEAMKWYQESADQGNADAQDNLGLMYEHGLGVKQDYARAAVWYQKSAKQGNDDAQNRLGDMYYYGNGVQQDYAEAVKWYKKSAEQGNKYAQNNLDYLYEHRNSITSNFDKTIKWDL